MPERIEVTALRNGGRDFIEAPTTVEAWVAALLAERRGYQQRGLPDRVAAVDAELTRMGHIPEKLPVKGARSERERGRHPRGG